MIKKRKAAERPANAAPAAKSARAYVVIDYPLEGEIVTSAAYTVRLGAGGAERVEVSFDGKEWQPARESVGYWWYDWTGYGAGAHTVVARAYAGKRAVKSKPRSLTVLI